MLPSLRWAVLGIIGPAGTALAEISDEVEDGRASHGIVASILLLLTAFAAMSGWRRALLLRPVTPFWGLVAFGSVREWREELYR